MHHPTALGPENPESRCLGGGGSLLGAVIGGAAPGHSPRLVEGCLYAHGLPVCLSLNPPSLEGHKSYWMRVYPGDVFLT